MGKERKTKPRSVDKSPQYGQITVATPELKTNILHGVYKSPKGDKERVGTNGSGELSRYA